MSNVVLDASAVLALLNGENGAEHVAELISFASICSVNVTEVLTRLMDLGQTYSEARTSFDLLHVRVISFDLDLAAKASELRSLTKHLGLSLGDSSCLALATNTHSAAVTADTSWKDLSFCSVELIR
ncbi:MAG: type II toxin-antitoxin system VapC family toxin [Acidobacteria bacterium]|nr:type II toxin-antitoxin system VapC family toxin [Acidobacteriota bacterium]